MDLVYDMPHISISKENHFGKDVYVHRSNVSRAYGPEKMRRLSPRLDEGSTFVKTGEPVFIPSSMSTDAYVCVGTDKNEDSFFSAPHGTGKGTNAKEKSVATKDELFAKMKDKGVRLYNAQSRIVVNQDSARYKDIDKVMAGVEANGIARVVAKMKPMAVLMY
jgi:tRNA-splicing ligase RtcB